MPFQPAKVCPLITRPHPGGAQLLAFHHPSAGPQLIKGSLHPGEAPHTGARRELFEESGLRLAHRLRHLTTAQPGAPGTAWHVFHTAAEGLPDGWAHQTSHDHGHIFRFFWQPLGTPPPGDWHPLYRRIWHIAQPLIG